MVDHDKACDALKVDERPCYKKHNCYSSTTGVPRDVQAFEGAVIEYNSEVTKEEEVEETKWSTKEKGQARAWPFSFFPASPSPLNYDSITDHAR